MSDSVSDSGSVWATLRWISLSSEVNSDVTVIIWSIAAPDSTPRAFASGLATARSPATRAAFSRSAMLPVSARPRSRYGMSPPASASRSSASARSETVWALSSTARFSACSAGLARIQSWFGERSADTFSTTTSTRA